MRKVDSVELRTCMVSELPHEAAELLGEVMQVL
jgi:hypothetical protein